MNALRFARARARVRAHAHTRGLALAAALALPAFAALGPVTAPAAHAASTADTASTESTASSGYRYWSFWTGNEKDGNATDHGSDADADADADAWSYATEGPATQRPEDGDALGFRFALSEDSEHAKKPRGAAEFATACADTPKKSGTKRVALRLDFGTRADAPHSGRDKGEAPPKPRTACARVDDNASAATALAAVAEPLRYSTDSLLCAVDGYPAKGCGEQVTGNGTSGQRDDPGAGHSSGDSDSSSDGKGGGSEDDGTMSRGLGLTAGIATVAILGAAALWQARRRRQ